MSSKSTFSFKSALVAAIIFCASGFNNAGLADPHTRLNSSDSGMPRIGNSIDALTFSKCVDELQQKLIEQQQQLEKQHRVMVQQQQLLTKQAGTNNHKNNIAQSVCEFAYVCANYAHWSSQTSLDFDKTFITDLTVGYLATLKRLQVLRLNDTAITAVGLRSLVALPKLTALELSDTKMRPDDYKILGQFSSLTNVNLNGTAVNDAALNAMSELKHLEVLRINRTQVTGSGLQRFPALPNLKELDVVSCPNLGPVAFKYIGQMYSLEHLQVYKTDMRDSGLYDLKDLRLKVLRASDTNITDKSMSLLKNMPLRWLMVARTRVTDAGVAQVIDLPLERLRLADNKDVTDKSIPLLLTMKRLKNLDIKGTSITSEGRSRLRIAGLDLNPNGIP